MEAAFILNVDTSKFEENEQSAVLVLDDISQDIKIKDLKKKISVAAGIPLQLIHIWYGLTPQPTPSDDATLEDLNVQNGETVRVEDTSLEIIPGENDSSQILWERGIIKYNPSTRNNSSLFISIHFLLFSGKESVNKAFYLRKSIEEVIRKYPERHATLISALQVTNEEYCAWITDPEYWGYDIECHILSILLNTEIVVFDINSNEVSCFPETRNTYDCRIYLLKEKPYYYPIFIVVNTGVRVGIFEKTNNIVHRAVLDLVNTVRAYQQQKNPDASRLTPRTETVELIILDL